MSGTPCNVCPARTGTERPLSRKAPTRRKEDWRWRWWFVDQLAERNAVERQALGVRLDAYLVGTAPDQIVAPTFSTFASSCCNSSAT